MTTLTATDARKQFFTLIDDVAESYEPIQIAGKRHSAVYCQKSNSSDLISRIFELIGL